MPALFLINSERASKARINRYAEMGSLKYFFIIEIRLMCLPGKYARIVLDINPLKVLFHNTQNLES